MVAAEKNVAIKNVVRTRRVDDVKARRERDNERPEESKRSDKSIMRQSLTVNDRDTDCWFYVVTCLLSRL